MDLIICMYTCRCDEVELDAVGEPTLLRCYVLGDGEEEAKPKGMYVCMYVIVYVCMCVYSHVCTVCMCLQAPSRGYRRMPLVRPRSGCTTLCFWLKKLMT